jgi:hypothetical protein
MTQQEPLMAQRPSTIEFENVPLEEARRISRGPRMDPELYHAVKANIQSLDNTTTRLTIPEGTSTTTMKHRILRVAAELNIPVTVRKISGGLLFWRSTDEDLQQATEVAARLQSARQPPHTSRRSRRPTGIARYVNDPPWELSDDEANGCGGECAVDHGPGRDDRKRAGA